MGTLDLVDEVRDRENREEKRPARAQNEIDEGRVLVTNGQLNGLLPPAGWHGESIADREETPAASPEGWKELEVSRDVRDDRGGFHGWNPNRDSCVLGGRGDRHHRPAGLLLSGRQERLAVPADPPGVDVDRRSADRALRARLRVGRGAERAAE